MLEGDPEDLALLAFYERQHLAAQETEPNRCSCGFFPFPSANSHLIGTDEVTGSTWEHEQKLNYPSLPLENLGLRQVIAMAKWHHA